MPWRGDLNRAQTSGHKDGLPMLEDGNVGVGMALPGRETSDTGRNFLLTLDLTTV